MPSMMKKSNAIATNTITTNPININIIKNNWEIIQENAWIWTFITNDWWFITAAHVIQQWEYAFSISNNWVPVINETIIIHPTLDIALIKLLDTTSACTPLAEKTEIIELLNESEGNWSIINFSHDSVIKPWMSWTPLLSKTGKRRWIITQKDELNEKKWQGIYLSMSLFTWINDSIWSNYLTLCNSEVTIP